MDILSQNCKKLNTVVLSLYYSFLKSHRFTLFRNVLKHYIIHLVFTCFLPQFVFEKEEREAWVCDLPQYARDDFRVEILVQPLHLDFLNLGQVLNNVKYRPIGVLELNHRTLIFVLDFLRLHALLLLLH